MNPALRHFWPVRLWLMMGLCGLAASMAPAAGVPEPSLVMYGVVTDAQGIRLTNGTLVVTIRPSNGGAAFQRQTSLADVNGQFSYVLLIPCETELPGFLVTAPDRLKLSSDPLEYDRSEVTLDGVRILYTTPGLGLLRVTSKDRGRFDRVDLSPSGTSDYDTNGLLKSWELRYFGQLGVDPKGDPDGDGMPNLEEMLAGTDPTNSQSKLGFISVEATPVSGVQVVWSSEAGRVYTVFRSVDLRTGFVPIGAPQPATPPANIFVDTTAAGAGPYFYIVKVVTP